MLISTQIAFAMRCPKCGRMEMTTLSRFVVRPGSSLKLRCSCGADKFVVSHRDQQIRLRIPCFLCEGLHHYHYSPREFWHAPLTGITCPETDLQLGVLGPVPQVDAYLRAGGTELDRLLEDEAFGEYFERPDVMYRVLSWVNRQVAEGNLTCACGNQQITVDVYSDRLDLTCPVCGRRRPIRAARDEDLAVLERMTGIRVGDDQPGRRKGHNK
ncbi:MAG TPA: hypothetical protein VIL07_09460 [Symbiobacteriaceae bacterium]